jgi:hypothetical protein
MGRGSSRAPLDVWDGARSSACMRAPTLRAHGCGRLGGSPHPAARGNQLTFDLMVAAHLLRRERPRLRLGSWRSRKRSRALAGDRFSQRPRPPTVRPRLRSDRSNDRHHTQKDVAAQWPGSTTITKRAALSRRPTVPLATDSTMPGRLGETPGSSLAPITRAWGPALGSSLIPKEEAAAPERITRTGGRRFRGLLAAVSRMGAPRLTPRR